MKKQKKQVKRIEQITQTDQIQQDQGPNRKSEILFDGLTEIRDDLIDQARPLPKKFWTGRRFAAAAAAAAVIITGVFATQPLQKQTAAAQTIAEAEYPEPVPYPNQEEYVKKNGAFDDEQYSKAYDAWWEDARAKRELAGNVQGMDGFIRKSAGQFLSSKKAQNTVYSPLNVYMALGMLAELTDGNSRQQILDLLGSEDVMSLREQIARLWDANYYDDGVVTSILAASLWLNEDVPFVQSTMDTLAASYRASSYRGKMGSASFDKCLQDWLNAQTGGLLKEQASSEKMTEDTILALATTIYFRAQWNTKFSASATKEEVFHAADGDLTCKFMHKDECGMTYYWGDQFSAVAQGLEQSGSMWLILPDEGVSPNDLLEDAQAMDFLVSNHRSEWEDRKEALVNLAVPQFDVVSRLDLCQGLKDLGITDVFDMGRSDFSNMTTAIDEVYLSKASHAARVAVDEEGVTAAAYTVMEADAGGAMPQGEEIDFVLDRPFLFVVTGMDGMPLFMGVVQQP